MQGSQGIATYQGPSGGTTTQPVLNWMSPPKEITVGNEVRTLVLCTHAEPTDALVREQTERVHAERQEQHEAAGRRRAFNVRLYGGAA